LTFIEGLSGEKGNKGTGGTESVNEQTLRKEDR